MMAVEILEMGAGNASLKRSLKPTGRRLPCRPIPALSRPPHRQHPPGGRDPEDQPSRPPEGEGEPPPIIAGDEAESECIPIDGPRLRKRLVKQPETPATALSGEQRLLLLATWRRSGLPGGDMWRSWNARFRSSRDYLYERDIVVAGRPLPDGVPIRLSTHSGTASRGQ
jgi:hypothetical protein